MALVIDVSNVNGWIDWAAVKKAGIENAFLKASEGLTFSDGTFAMNRERANAQGIRVGYYHYARPDVNPRSPALEAKHFTRVVGKVGINDLKPVLDFEVDATNLPGSQQVAWARAFSHTVKQGLGLYPIFYSYAAFIHSLASYTKSPIGDGLWLAAYGRDDGKEYPVTAPPPWKKIVAHQFTSRGKLAGHAGFVDFSNAPNLNALLAHPIRGRLGV